MYRSFMTCDDPKGVVECGKIRKYRTCSQQMKDKTKIQLAAKNLETSLINERHKEENVLKGSIQKFMDPSSLQLTSGGGDQCLNSMSDSWSRDLRYNGRSEGIGKDLLKGALDLQDSLVKLEGLDSASETPSTSPSQSFGVQVDRLSDPSYKLTTSKMERGINLVAKLMGLEEAPSTSLPSVMQKQLDGEKILNPKRPPLLEINIPKIRKNNSIVEKVSPEGKAQRETLQIIHFKGLSNKSFVLKPKLQVHPFNDPHSKLFDDSSNIVLMKPQCTPKQESVKTQAPVPPEELSLRKLEVEVVSSKRLTKEKGPKFLKEVVRLNGKGMNPHDNEKYSGKVKLHCHLSHTSQVSETALDEKCKVQTTSRKLPEMDISEPRNVARIQDQREITSTKLTKPQSGSRIDKNEISSLKSTASDTISISKTDTQKINDSKDPSKEINESGSVVDCSTHRKNQMKKLSPVAESEAAKPIAEQIEQGEERKSNDVPCKDDNTEIRIATRIVDELLMGCEALASANKIGEECKRSNGCSGHDNMRLKSEREASESTNCGETDRKHDKEGAQLKHFLLTSQSFIGHAEELFNLDVDCPKSLQKDETNGVANLRLYLDCANEFTERKSLQESRVVRSFLLTCAGNSRLHICLGRLVEEIYNAIENLKFYSESSGDNFLVDNSGDNFLADNLFAMMEKDMNCNGLVNGIWEWGWRHGFSADEAELVVNEVESQLISGLIEEVIINL